MYPWHSASSKPLSRVLAEVANSAGHMPLKGWLNKDKPQLRQGGQPPSSTLSPQMTWKDHKLPEKQRHSVYHPPLQARIQFSDSWDFIIGSQSLDRSPVSNSQACYQSAKAGVISIMLQLPQKRKCSRVKSWNATMLNLFLRSLLKQVILQRGPRKPPLSFGNPKRQTM